ncbi:MAG: hypothetical protein WAT66_13150 [Actinomycetota bacterium]
MEPDEAAARVLDAADEPLHWTVIWDRALRDGLIDPMTQPDARDELMRWLAQAARSGEIEKTSTGTYRRRGSEG